MRKVKTDLPDVFIIEYKTYFDERGYFRETYHEDKFSDIDIGERFFQDSIVRSKHNVLRGLHFQEPFPQGKLVQVVRGEIFDVVVDIRQGSPCFTKWFGQKINDTEGKALWIPEGFAHGYVVLSEFADVAYKVTNLWVPGAEHIIRWNDPTIGIKWPLSNPILAEKDADAPTLGTAKVLPNY